MGGDAADQSPGVSEQTAADQRPDKTGLALPANSET
jgi:hypothetical protein